MAELPATMLAGQSVDSGAGPPDGSPLGETTVTSMFRQGGVMVLQSVASGKTLSIYNGQVSGNGIRDNCSQFIIHIRSSGTIALQSAANCENWLGIFEGKTLGDAHGGPYSEFNLREIDDKYVSLESVFCPGQYVVVDENGEVQSPVETPATHRSSLFIPFPHSTPTQPFSGYQATTVSLPQSSDNPPPYHELSIDQGEMQGGQSVPAMKFTAPPSLPPYLPPSHMSHTPPGMLHASPGPQYMQPGTPESRVPPQQPTPVQPTTPLGYQVMDLFNRYNKVVLIPFIDLSGRAISVCRGIFDSGSLRTGGNYLNSECEFMFEPTSQGVFLLINPISGRSVSVSDSQKVTLMRLGSCDIGCEFIVRLIAGANVAFESVKFPGNYLSVGPDGLVKLVSLHLESVNVQFTIRVIAFKGPYTTNLKSPFNPSKESIVNHLKDKSVVQLYHKPTMSYLCLVEGGRVLPTPHENEGTFLVYRDRGMGRVSFSGYHKGIMKIRMEFSGRLSSVGADDVNSDFIAKECPDGTLQFQSVPYPQFCIHSQFKGVKITSFSVYLVDMNTMNVVGRNQTLAKYALN